MRAASLGPAPSRPSEPGAAAPTSAAPVTGPRTPPRASGPAARHFGLLGGAVLHRGPARFAGTPGRRPGRGADRGRYHSGSHFTTVQALETVLAPEDVSLTFQGPPNERLDTLLDRQVPAATLFGVPLYIAEAFGFRKVLDATFMVGFLVTGDDVSEADITRYLAALRRAQMDIDLHPSATSTTTCGPCRRSTATRSTCAPSAPASASSSCPIPGRSSPPPRTGTSGSSPTCPPRYLRRSRPGGPVSV